MKILMPVWRVPPYFGGVETHVHNIANRLCKLSHEVTICVKSSQTQFSSDKLYKAITGYPDNLEQFDIIHCHDFHTWDENKLKNVHKKYITFHGWEGCLPINETVKKYRQKIDSQALGNISIGEYISKWYGTKKDIISYGATDFTNLNGKKQKDKIVYIGRAELDQSCFEFIEAVKELRNQKCLSEIVFLGDGSKHAELLKINNEYNLKIDFRGFVGRSEILDNFREARVIFACGYLSILDGLACGVPVISHYSNELKYDYYNMMEYTPVICKTVKEIVENLFEPSILSDEAIWWAKSQTWEKLVNQYLNLWRR